MRILTVVVSLSFMLILSACNRKTESAVIAGTLPEPQGQTRLISSALSTEPAALVNEHDATHQVGAIDNCLANNAPTTSSLGTIVAQSCPIK